MSIQKIRGITFTSMDFDPVNKVSFSSETVDDYNIKNTLGDMRIRANSGGLSAVPVNMAKESELTNHVYQRSDKPDTAATKAARKAGTPVYTVIPTYTVFLEQGDGKPNPERKRASVAGLKPLTDMASLIS